MHLQYAQAWLLQRQWAVRLLGESVCWCRPLHPWGAPVILVGADSWLYGLLPHASTVQVAATPAAICRWPELAFQLHQAPEPGAVGAQVRLDLGG